MTFQDFKTEVATELQDGAGKLVQPDIDAAIRATLLDRYSKDRPQSIVTDVASNGTAQLGLPVVPPAGGQNPPPVPVFEVGFSIVKQIEYPIGNMPPSLFFDNDWEYYQSPTGWVLNLIGETGGLTPNNGTLLRVTWTARHFSDGSSVFPQDFYPVCYFATSLCFEKLAAIYGHTRDNTVGADIVNYRTKAQEALTNAKAARTRYFNAMGIDEGDSGPEQGPAISTGEQTEILQGGVPRLIHTKYSR